MLNNGVNFIKQTDWTLLDGPLEPNLFYTNKLHLIEEGRAKLLETIHDSINNDFNFNKSHSISSKQFAYETYFSLRYHNFPALLCNVSVPNYLCNVDKTIVKFVIKSIIKLLVLVLFAQGNVHTRETHSSSSVHPCKPIRSNNIRSIKPVTSSNACLIKPISGGNISSSKIFNLSYF